MNYIDYINSKGEKYILIDCIGTDVKFYSDVPKNMILEEIVDNFVLKTISRNEFERLIK